MSIDYTTCCYSPCGKYIAAGGPNGEISVWDIENNRLIKEENKGSDAQSITSIQWNPLNNGEIAYMDNTGQFGLITNIFDDDNNILDRDELIVEVDNDMDFDGSKYRHLQFKDFLNDYLTRFVWHFQLNSMTMTKMRLMKIAYP